MTPRDPPIAENEEQDQAAFSSLRDCVKGLYNNEISDQEAAEAAQNLLNFTRTLIAIRREMNQNRRNHATKH